MNFAAHVGGLYIGGTAAQLSVTLASTERVGDTGYRDGSRGTAEGDATKGDATKAQGNTAGLTADYTV